MLGANLNIDALAIEAGEKWGIEPALVKAHMRVESSFNPMARRDEPTIKDASWGLMQILLKTARQISKNPNLTATDLLKPEINVDIGAHYIAQNLSRYKGNIKDAIAAYNAGSARKNANGLYVNSKGIANVQPYVDKVYTWYLAYKGLSAGKEIIKQAVEPNKLPMYGLIAIIGIATFLFLKGDKKSYVIT